MQPRQLIGTAKIPGGDELRLFRRGDDFMIVHDRNDLMNTRMSGSEEALATMTCVRVRDAVAAAVAQLTESRPRKPRPI
jgi:hypothetical protein